MLSQLDITACIKNRVYNNFNLRCYFTSSIIERLYRSFSFISSVQIQLALEILRNCSAIFRSSHGRCSIKKLSLKILRYSQENTYVGVSFLVKLQAFRPSGNCIKKGLKHKHFIVNIGTFIRTPILKNQKQPPKVFCKEMLKLRPATLLTKRLWHRCFPVNFCEISNNTFFTEHLWATASEQYVLSTRRHKIMMARQCSFISQILYIVFKMKHILRIPNSLNSKNNPKCQ